MPAMTKPQRAKLTKLEAARSAACDAVYACAPNQNTVFSECLKLAAGATADAYNAACTALMNYQFTLSDDGRGYWVGGQFREYTK